MVMEAASERSEGCLGAAGEEEKWVLVIRWIFVGYSLVFFRWCFFVGKSDDVASGKIGVEVSRYPDRIYSQWRGCIFILA
jgi:hypothetical protein